MVGFLVKTAIRLFIWAAVLYVVFFVPLGERTLYQHMARIAATPEAKELGGEVGDLVDAAGEQARERVLDPARGLVGGETLAADEP